MPRRHFLRYLRSAPTGFLSLKKPGAPSSSTTPLFLADRSHKLSCLAGPDCPGGALLGPKRCSPGTFPFPFRSRSGVGLFFHSLTQPDACSDKGLLSYNL